jgi:hypothetical protein
MQNVFFFHGCCFLVLGLQVYFLIPKGLNYKTVATYQRTYRRIAALLIEIYTFRIMQIIHCIIYSIIFSKRHAMSKIRLSYKNCTCPYSLQIEIKLKTLVNVITLRVRFS